MRVGANAEVLGDGSPPAGSMGGATVKGLGTKLKALRKCAQKLVKSEEEF